MSFSKMNVVLVALLALAVGVIVGQNFGFPTLSADGGLSMFPNKVTRSMKEGQMLMIYDADKQWVAAYEYVPQNDPKLLSGGDIVLRACRRTDEDAKVKDSAQLSKGIVDGTIGKYKVEHKKELLGEGLRPAHIGVLNDMIEKSDEGDKGDPGKK